MGGLDQLTLDEEGLSVEKDYNIPQAPGKGFNVSPDKGLEKWLHKEAKKHGVEVTQTICPVTEVDLGKSPKAQKYSKLEEFQYDEFLEARNQLPESLNPFVTPIPKEEYIQRNADLYLAANKRSGYAIIDGDLVSVFSLPGEHSGKHIIASAIKNGAKTLDCFDGYLPKLYGNFGFVEYQRYKWDNQYAPEGWDYKKYGKPDVIFMKKDEKKNSLDYKSQKGAIPNKKGKLTKEFLLLQKKYIEYLFGKKETKNII
jgi:hypothetical protein